jgi:hypothetical protein
VYRRDLLRPSHRDERERPQKETLPNQSALPEVAIEALRKVLSGTVLVEPDQAFEIEWSVSHSGVAAVQEIATRPGIKTPGAGPRRKVRQDTPQSAVMRENVTQPDREGYSAGQVEM